jgi:hypothetical protein|tara:strand:+ start:277 stop:501 length:225 start_codon:yes stop_codon:yes gene_type:complete
MIKRLMMLKRLNLPDDILWRIKMEIKYEALQKNYDKEKINLLEHIKYYQFINVRINKRHKRQDTLLKTILFFDI